MSGLEDGRVTGTVPGGFRSTDMVPGSHSDCIAGTTDYLFCYPCDGPG
ncbi:hypothetical protein LHT11_15115 [Acetobacter indonesiensis]|nr:hypothetical protein [Acetobacter indonesiensis]MCG0996498.1 hypothetical protein [Acetobacter indonesiensis]